MNPLEAPDELSREGAPSWEVVRARLRDSLGLELRVERGALTIRSGELEVRVEATPVAATRSPQNPLFLVWSDLRYQLCRYQHRGRELHAFELAFALNPMNSAILSVDRAAVIGILEDAGVSAPRAVACPTTRPEEAEAALRRGGIDFPLVVRPPAGFRGGVLLGVRDLAELRRCLGAFARALPVVLLQEQIPARHELRLLVLDGEVRAVSRKRRPVVTGDGAATVAELAERENALRRGIQAPLSLLEPCYGTRVRQPLAAGPELQRALAAQGLTLEDRPAAGRRVALRSGRTLEVHEDGAGLAGPEQRRLALAATAALDLRAAWVDLALTADGASFVLEVSPRPRPDPYLIGPTPVDLLTPLLSALFSSPRPASVSWRPAPPAPLEVDAEVDSHPAWSAVVARVQQAIGAELSSQGGGRRVVLEKAGRRFVEEETLHPSWLPLFDNPLPRRIRRYSLEPEGRRLHGNRLLDLLTHTLNTASATLCAFDKLATIEILTRAGLPLVRGGVAGSLSEALALLPALGLHYPLVCKPVYGLKGIGVTVGIGDADALAAAFELALTGGGQVIVEELFVGREFRVITLDGVVTSRLEKLYPSVRGDGQSTVEELIERQNQLARALRPPALPLLAQYYPPAYELPLDEELAQTLAGAGLTLASVPPAGLEVTCRKLRNLAQGARWVRAERLPRRADQVSIEAQQAVGLRTAAIDLLIADPDDERSELRVLEVNGGYGAVQSGIWEEIYDDVFFPSILAALSTP